MKKKARIKLPKPPQKPHIIGSRYTPAEFREIVAAARREQQTVSDWQRQAVLAHIAQQQLPPSEMPLPDQEAQQ